MSEIKSVTLDQYWSEPGYSLAEKQDDAGAATQNLCS